MIACHSRIQQASHNWWFLESYYDSAGTFQNKMSDATKSE